jgi:Rps23 Pro-64 3,4-dihydroxylase Tpa1-like proline 4-hydroxylase
MEYLSAEYSNLRNVADNFKKEYKEGSPFPNIYFQDFFNEKMLDEVLNEFPDLDKGPALKLNHDNSRKLASKGEERFGQKSLEFTRFLNSEKFLVFLNELTSVEIPLIPDPYFFGGGFHQIKRNGFLKVHADFNKHDKLLLDRRLNVLIYLNKDWKPEYGGDFELWDKEMKNCVNKIPPLFNTLAIFSTTSFSYHGHPNPLNCPENMSRKSLALYYYTNGRPSHEIVKGIENHSTLYKERSGVIADRPSTIKKIKSLIKDFIPPIIMNRFR